MVCVISKHDHRGGSLQFACRVIYGNLKFTVGLMDKFVHRGLTAGGWPADSWPCDDCSRSVEIGDGTSG